MAISSISQTPPIVPLTSGTSGTPPTVKRASDGDTPAIEAAESAATKLAEKTNGGFVNRKV